MRVHLFQHSHESFDGGHQGAGRFAHVVVVHRLLLLCSLQTLLSLAQSAFHLVQLLRQGFVGLLQLRFRLSVFLWK